MGKLCFKQIFSGELPNCNSQKCHWNFDNLLNEIQNCQYMHLIIEYCVVLKMNGMYLQLGILLPKGHAYRGNATSRHGSQIKKIKLVKVQIVATVTFHFNKLSSFYYVSRFRIELLWEINWIINTNSAISHLEKWAR